MSGIGVITIIMIITRDNLKWNELLMGRQEEHEELNVNL